MKPTQIEHIGIAVRSIEDALKFYENVLGLRCYKTETVVEQKVKTAFLKIGEVKIELLEPTDNESPVAKFIEKRGEGIHHIAYKTENIENDLAELSGKNVRLIDENPRDGADNMKIAFIHPKSAFGVLTEICQPKTNNN